MRAPSSLEIMNSLARSRKPQGMERQMSEGDYRELARTIIHEAMHAIGFDHPFKPWSQPYVNAPPAYIGCLIQQWPNKRAMATGCGHAKS